MYYAHFGLKEPPFKITPNTEFFFNGSNRGAVLDALIYAITSGEGIVKVVGEVGSGKTMLCRMLQTSLPDSVERIYLANPSVAPEDILHAIAFELGLKLPKNADKLKVMQALQTYLLERHAAGKQVVIFVEEAQGMPLATLEEIRLLSNLETKHDKLLQMVLFGQPELDVNLNQTHIRQLRERITHSFNLSPLHTKEIGEYLIFRLRAAGYFGPHLFSNKAIAKLASASEGLVRRVNILADKALLAAFADNVYQVTPKHVHAAIADSEFGAEKAKKASKKWWVLGLLAVVLSGVLLGYLAHYYQSGALNYLFWNNKNDRSLNSQDAVKNLAPEKNQGHRAVKSGTAQPATSPESTSAAVPAASISDQMAPVAVQLAPTAPLLNSVDEAKTAQANVAVQPSAVVQPNAASSSVTQLSTMPSSPATSVGAVANAAVVPAQVAAQATSQPLSTTSAAPAIINAPIDMLHARLDATKQWLANATSDTVTIQLLGTSDEAQLTEQLAQLTKSIELDNLYVYQTYVRQQPFYTVVYGSFVNRLEANAALKKLPNNLQKNRPHLRTVAGILAETNKNG